ncbi:DUF262 domain-containing HNH endonuclease family protein [Rhizobium sp.]|uniref:DUF262 domain-containing protein n=1 Tax=Rhizobium sp. TaxID=391 RepID=UPI0028B14DA6
MKPYTRSIIELFDGKRRYLIPLYQRQYAWKTSPQLELLWEDIESATVRLKADRASVSPHFMGAIVISQVKTYGKEVQAFEIIDGQQRLTTFQLLLTALRDVAAKFESSYADEVSKYLENTGMMETPAIERFKLWPSLMDRRAFVSLIDKDADLDKIAKKPLDEDGIVKPAVAAHAYFQEKIAAHVTSEGQFDEHAMDILFEALKDGLAVVSIELEGGDDPQTIFETLNSRGVDLTAGDLMRNFIFQRAKGLGQKASSLIVDELYEKYWLPLDHAFWTENASRGRQTSSRLSWMLTDHVSMHLADTVSIEKLFDTYRRWILGARPFADVSEELVSISATAEVERRIFERTKGDPLGRFGIFADAFDVSTAMPLVIYLASKAEIGSRLPEALQILESYILRRDVCGLTTKAYNRLFVSILDKVRKAECDKVLALIETLSSRTAEIDKWPNDAELLHAWLGRDQYKGQRQPRLRYIFEMIEQRKRSKLNEDIEIKSALSIEHIMPRGWKEHWPIPELENMAEDELDHILRSADREQAINKFGNLTLLTQSLNATVSNGPFSVKMPAVRSNSSLALNRELNGFDTWNEDTIKLRGNALFETARQIWTPPSS